VRGPIACSADADRVGRLADMGDRMGDTQQGNVEETIRRARDEMHSVTASLRALLADLRGEPELPSIGARTPESAPNP
jgi:hypothetical protein